MSDVSRTLNPHISQGLDRSGSLITSTTGRLLGVLIFTGLIYVGANIRIPLQPVPVTLQTLFVLLAGAVLGRGFGALSSGLYLLLGLVGLEILAGNPTGWAVFTGPTGGYVAGFVVAPLLIGGLIQRHQSTAWVSLVFGMGTLVILALGVLHLTLFYTRDLGVSLQLGLYPFIIGEILKIAAAGSIYRSFIALRRHYSAR